MKLKPWVKVFLIFIILGSVLFLGIKYFKKDNVKIDKSILEKYNIPESKKSKTLEYVLNNDIYNEAYLDEYEKINYENQDNFKEILITFLPKGYKGDEINYIFKLSESNLEKLKSKDYQDIKNFYKIKNFDVDNIDRYNKYYSEHKYSYEDVVTYVNIKLDLPVYTDTVTVSDTSSMLVLVNKYNCLPKDYSPSDIEYAKGAYGNNVPMRKVAFNALEELQEAVKKEADFSLLPTTAYRNYNFQNTLYSNYVKSDGVEAADTYSARPGCSEHQTGLAIDLRNPALSSDIRLTDENYDWLKNNAYRFGFIIRFPKDKEFITGYQEENWHIRYVGKDIAKIIYENNLTLEEYIDLYEKEY